MAKTNGTVRLIGLIIVILVLVVGIAGTWRVYGVGIAQNAKEVSDLDTGGCAPAQVHTTQIAVLETKQQTILDDVAEIKVW